MLGVYPCAPEDVLDMGPLLGFRRREGLLGCQAVLLHHAANVHGSTSCVSRWLAHACVLTHNCVCQSTFTHLGGAMKSISGGRIQWGSCREASRTASGGWLTSMVVCRLCAYTGMLAVRSLSPLVWVRGGVCEAGSQGCQCRALCLALPHVLAVTHHCPHPSDCRLWT
jgi:hypothetical protein